jgi:hypothetical protein
VEYVLDVKIGAERSEMRIGRRGLWELACITVLSWIGFYGFFSLLRALLPPDTEVTPELEEFVKNLTIPSKASEDVRPVIRGKLLLVGEDSSISDLQQHLPRCLGATRNGEVGTVGIVGSREDTGSWIRTTTTPSHTTTEEQVVRRLSVYLFDPIKSLPLGQVEMTESSWGSMPIATKRAMEWDLISAVVATDHYDSGNGSLVDNDLRVVEWLKLNLNMAAVSCTVILWFGLFVRWLYRDKPWTY